MASINKRNILLPAAGLVTLVFVGGVVYKAVTKAGPVVVEGGSEMSSSPSPTEPDADSPSDTIRSLRGQVEILQSSTDEVNLSNDELKKNNEALLAEREKLAQDFSAKLQAKLATQAEASQSQTSNIQARIESINSSFEKFAGSMNNRLTSVEETTEVPAGFGLGEGASYQSGSTVNGDQVSGVFWVNPLDVPPVRKEGEKTGFTPEFVKNAANTVGKAADSVQQKVAANPLLASAKNKAGQGEEATPYYTLPDLSSLISSTTLTSLIGRVYLTDEIKNPHPFKIVVGRKNLTANFKDLPAEIEGMIFEGYATGDWPLSCIRGTLNAATFVFNDGTVRSAYPGDAGSRPEEGGASVNKSIGYISDPWGNTCISGERVTDAPKFLLQRALLAGAEGYASALRQEHIDNQNFTSPDGTTSSISSLTGDATKFAEANAYYTGIHETTEWIKERQKQSFDAIYAPSGQTVVINLQQELRLDLDPNGRKINYANEGTLHGQLD